MAAASNYKKSQVSGLGGASPPKREGSGAGEGRRLPKQTSTHRALDWVPLTRRELESQFLTCTGTERQPHLLPEAFSRTKEITKVKVTKIKDCDHITKGRMAAGRALKETPGTRVVAVPGTASLGHSGRLRLQQQGLHRAS